MRFTQSRDSIQIQTDEGFVTHEFREDGSILARSQSLDPFGVKDTTAALQAMVDSLPAEGGDIAPGLGSFRVDGTVSVVDKTVRILGSGARHNIYLGAPTTGTIFKRVSGAGPMFEFKSTAAGSTSSQDHSGCGMRSCTIDANALASQALKLTSMYGGTWKDLHIRNATVAGLDLTTVDLSGVEDTQFNGFERITIRQTDGAGGSGIGLRMGSWQAGGGNSSGNDFLGLLIYHHDGGGIQMGDADSNRFVGCVANWTSGVGIGLELKASNTAFTGHARANAFWHCEFANGIVARGTPSGSTPSANNWLFWSRESSGGATLTKEAGATFYYEELSTGNTVRDTFTLSGGPAIKSSAGSPEGVITAVPGSYCADSTNGEGYIKKSGTGNTGWKLVTHA